MSKAAAKSASASTAAATITTSAASSSSATSSAGRLSYLVTGATGVIGREIALGIARQPSQPMVFVAARNKQKGDTLIEELKNETKNPNIAVEVFDLSEKKSILEWAAGFRARQQSNGGLNVLINNA